MNRRLPPNLSVRTYRTRGGYKRITYRIRFIDWKGKRRTFPAIEDFNTAKAEVSRLKELNRQHYDFDAVAPTGRETLFPWVAKYLAATSNENTRQRYEYATNRLKQGLGDVLLELLNHTVLLEYRKHRRADKCKDSTINREMQSLRSILRMAYFDGKLAKVPMVPFKQEHNERTRTATDSEYRKILAKLPGDDRDCAEIVREMGFRPAEVLAITPADLILSSRSIDTKRIRKKRGLKAVIPLSQRAHTILSRRAKGKGPSERLFAFTRHQVRMAFFRACKALGIDNLWLYDLKATFATDKERQGYPRKAIMAITGHRTEYAFQRYSRPTDEDLKALMTGTKVVPVRKKGRVS